MIQKSEVLNQFINWLDEIHNMGIICALNIVQFVEIYEKIWYNKVSETNTF